MAEEGERHGVALVVICQELLPGGMDMKMGGDYPKD